MQASVPPSRPARARMAGLGLASSPGPRLEPGIGHWWRRQAPGRPRVALDAAELIQFPFPRLAERCDLLVAAANEVPPHDDVLLERRAAEQQDPRRLASEVGQFHRGGPGRQVAQLSPLEAGT